ncbi:phosphohistidine phosphatase [Nocardiopsis mwathae]|uniref:Phosphohistidine phosphatase n=1 Tax=Nocardiopsis mwathae TaxID=1472723 RepID=A0A7W9YLE9_9ACTN|nr:histidine phosphatase family protein [Nocardiopsis mwathae]MBB6174149.1 phosphohistidine phosphatase [Nocardiopsis mwathae]
MTDKRLIILRHAKAEHGYVGTDHERELTDKGRKQAANVGKLLAESELIPDHVICSTAARTRRTLELALQEMPGQPTVAYESVAYMAGIDTIFELINAVDADIDTLMVVGHNPTMAQLAAAFLGDEPLMAFPTASVAVVDLEVDWLYAAPDTGTARILT